MTCISLDGRLRFQLEMPPLFLIKLDFPHVCLLLADSRAAVSAEAFSPSFKDANFYPPHRWREGGMLGFPAPWSD